MTWRRHGRRAAPAEAFAGQKWPQAEGEDVPVDERVPHAGGDGGGLRRVTQSEHALDDRQLRTGGLQAAERTPVVDHHPRRYHLAAPVHGPRLHTSASCQHQTPNINIKLQSSQLKLMLTALVHIGGH